MKARPKTIEEINKTLEDIMEEIKQEELFETLDRIDRDMDTYPNPSEKQFYQKCQDGVNLLGNKIIEYYYTLSAILESYIVKRSFELSVEFEASGKDKSITVNGKTITLSRVPSKDTLSDAAKSEVEDLNYAVIVLKGWKNRSISSLQTARSHCYSGIDKDKEDNEDKE